MSEQAVTHDILLTRNDGYTRKFRVYGRPMPEIGEILTLPVDGRLVKARVVVSPSQGETGRSDAEALELLEGTQVELL